MFNCRRCRGPVFSLRVSEVAVRANNPSPCSASRGALGLIFQFLGLYALLYSTNIFFWLPKVYMFNYRRCTGPVFSLRDSEVAVRVQNPSPCSVSRGALGLIFQFLGLYPLLYSTNILFWIPKVCMFNYRRCTGPVFSLRDSKGAVNVQNPSPC